MPELTFTEMTAMLFRMDSKIDQLLKKVQDGIGDATKPDAPEYMSINEVSIFICRSKSTIYGMVNRNEIPNSKKGRRLVFERSLIQSWIEAGRRKTITEQIVESESEMIKMNKKK
jgi:excisionase family DNA binding protein